MTIIFYDGSTLTCSTLEPCNGDYMLADEHRIVDQHTIIRITD
jgi:hypothetical protein